MHRTCLESACELQQHNGTASWAAQAYCDYRYYVGDTGVCLLRGCISGSILFSFVGALKYPETEGKLNNE
jgi:hypothetical protein